MCSSRCKQRHHVKKREAGRLGVFVAAEFVSRGRKARTYLISGVPQSHGTANRQHLNGHSVANNRPCTAKIGHVEWQAATMQRTNAQVVNTNAARDWCAVVVKCCSALRDLLARSTALAREANQGVWNLCVGIYCFMWFTLHDHNGLLIRMDEPSNISLQNLVDINCYLTLIKVICRYASDTELYYIWLWHVKLSSIWTTCCGCHIS